MTISIDGKIHSAKLHLKYGQDFPKPRRSMELYISNLGNCLIYIVEVGIPEWAENFSVKVPIKFYITQIYDDKFKVTKIKKKPILHRIK